MLTTHLNLTVKQIADIHDRLKSLELINTFENQAIVATLVSQGQITSSELREIHDE